MFIEEFHKALAAGACDELLGTLRPIWDAHAVAVGEARSEINPESSAEHILAVGSTTPWSSAGSNCPDISPHSTKSPLSQGNSGRGSATSR